MTLHSSAQAMSPKDAANYGAARTRDLAFDAVHSLWRRRQSEGMLQSDLAKAIGRDEGWVSRTLNGPGNWTIRIFGTLVSGLNGELEINVHALEDPVPAPSNYDAYAEYADLANSTTATANSSYKMTWNTGTWEPDIAQAGDTGIVVMQIKRR